MSASCIGLAAAAALLISAAGTEAFAPPLAMNSVLRSTGSERKENSKLYSKSPWRRSDVEEKAMATATTSNGENRQGGLLRFFDDKTSSNDDQNKNGNTPPESVEKGPLGFLQKDVSPLAMDDEWAFSLDSLDASTQGQGDDGSSVAMMAGAGLVVVALAVAGFTALGMGVLDNFR